jgi:hypothetical protein
LVSELVELFWSAYRGRSSADTAELSQERSA